MSWDVPTELRIAPTAGKTMFKKSGSGPDEALLHQRGMRELHRRRSCGAAMKDASRN